MASRGSWEEWLRFFQREEAGRASVSSTSLSKALTRFGIQLYKIEYVLYLFIYLFFTIILTKHVFYVLCVMCIIVADLVSFRFRAFVVTRHSKNQRQSSLHRCLLWSVLHLCSDKRRTCLWFWPHQLSPAGLVCV